MYYSSIAVALCLPYRNPPISLVHQFLREVGLTVGPSAGLVNEVFFKGDQWLNKEGPLQQSWRNTDRLV